MTDAEMKKLIAELEAELGNGWMDVVDWLQEGEQTDALIAAIRIGNTAAAINIIQQGALRFAADVNNSFVFAARRAAKWLDPKVGGAMISFDGSNERAARYAASNRYDLRGTITRDQMAAIRGAIVSGVSDGINPLDIARDVRESIGLTDYQARIVRNYRRKLEQGAYMEALSARLSSGVSDNVIRRAMADGRALTPAQIATATERYRQNWITYRAETISRTEALRSAHDGTQELYTQAIENGQIPRRSLVRQWMPGPDTEDAREQHRAPELLEQRPAIGEPYILPDGTRMMHPGDPAGGAEHNANCRCREVVRFVSSVEAEQRLAA